MKTRYAVVLAPVCVMALAGCHPERRVVTQGSSGFSRGGPTGQVIPHGTIVGAFRIVGGPMQLNGSTPNRPLRGTMAAHLHTANGKVVATTVVPPSGRFSLDIAPGRYLLIGSTPQVHGRGPGCPASHPMTVAAGQTVRLHVDCDVP
jgi:hypothetical protein